MRHDNTNEYTIVNERNYAIDILRIVSMMMIISLHFFLYNPAVSEITLFSWSGVIKQILHSICLISVNCYILISGYYLHKFKFNLSKLLKLLCEVWLYSVVLYGIFLQNGLASLSIKELLFAFLPTMTRQYWFVTTYVGVYLLSPIFRDIVQGMSKRFHALSIFVGFMLFVAYYNLFFFCDNLNFGGSTGVVWFIYLYLCASYIFKYSNGKTKNNVRNYIICALLALGSQLPFIALYFFTRQDIFLKGATIFDSVYNSIFVFISSILFFKIFANLNISIKSKAKKKIISILSTSSFAVYLIHENKYVRSFLWNLIAIDLDGNPFVFVFYWIATVLGIYAICVMIDCVRKKVEAYMFEKLKNEIQNLEQFLKQLLDGIIMKI